MFETVIRNFKKWSELNWLFSNGAILGDMTLTDFDKEEEALEQILLQIRKGKHFQPGELIEMSTGWRFSIQVRFECVINADSSTMKGRQFTSYDDGENIVREYFFWGRPKPYENLYSTRKLLNLK